MWYLQNWNRFIAVATIEKCKFILVAILMQQQQKTEKCECQSRDDKEKKKQNQSPVRRSPYWLA